MFDVMIVDDDSEVRETLKLLIDWEGLGLRLCCEAGDSDAARELFLVYHPKVVIMDVNIPILSGIELAREFSGIDSEVRFIIITGCNDIEYVKNSVKLGAIDLIIKPIMQDEINASLGSVVQYFRRLQETTATSQAMTELLADSRPMLLEKFLSSLLASEQETVPEIMQKRLEAISFRLSGRSSAVVLIAPLGGILEDAEEGLTLVATKNVSDELLREAGFEPFSYYDDASTLVCLVNWDFDDGGDLLETLLNKVSEKLSFYFNIRMMAGIGSTVQSLGKLSASYREANMALNYQGILEDAPVVHFKNIRQIDAPVLQGIDQILRKVSLYFKNNNLAEIASLLQDYFGSLSASSPDCLDKAREFAFAYVSRLISDAITLGVDSATVNKHADILGKLSGAGNILVIRAGLCGMTESLLGELFQKRSDSTGFLIKAAKTYILEHLSDENLDLNKVSNHIGLSGDYFCRLFHKEVGVNFNNYLNEARIDRAKKLLSQTTKKVFEVSYEVGYANPKYFNYVFKHLVGVTPLEYKNSAEK